MKTAFLRTVAVEQSTEGTDHKTLLARAAGNSGNMLFESALDLQLTGDVDRLWRMADIPDDLDMLILSMSNFISPATDFTSLAATIEKKRVGRVVMIGCGAQTHGFDIDSITLTAGTKRFLDIIHERSASIGVRGQYTAELLTGMGYNKIEVIGCPSVYWPMEQGWPEFRSPAYPLPGAIHCTPTGKYRDSVGRLFRYGLEHSMFYMAQTEILYLTTGETRDYMYYTGDKEVAAKMKDYFLKFGKIFYDLREWVAFNAGLSFVLGSRFHGNIVTMLAGRPCLNMVFDSRTREMIDHFSLPYIHFEDFDASLPISHYVGLADFSLFRATYPTRLLEYMDFLDKNAIPHRIGEDYLGDIQKIEEFSPVQERSSRALLRNAILHGMGRMEFRSLLDKTYDTGRTAEQRNLIELARGAPPLSPAAAPVAPQLAISG